MTDGESKSATAGGNSSGTKAPIAHEVTRLLADWSHGDAAALEKLAPLVHQDLQRLAHGYMQGQRLGHTLQTAALVNEAYLRLAGQERPSFTNRAHFLAVAATAMRQILVDHAKASQRQKRGAGARRVELDEAALILPQPATEILALNHAMEKLATLDERKARVVEMKYFGGLKEEEIAEVLKISPVTVRRDWVFSKAWLYAELHSNSR